ncbi:MAG: prepilin peptidase [Patescibacteria group bacterium]|nr:prepilin peptidase [Patescibacteria group bacterium]
MLESLIFILGSCFGSFISVLTSRLPKGEDFVFKPSYCPQCKQKLIWKHNIPLLGFLLLRGRCAFCHKRISYRYFLLEIVTGALFVFASFYLKFCQDTSLLCNKSGYEHFISLLSLFVIITILVSIFLIDYDYMIIPDELVFFLLGVSILLLILFNNGFLYSYLFSGFLASNFLLLLHFVTGGRGMGLGDVKLSLPVGIILGLNGTIYWLMVSFVVGGIFSAFLLFAKKIKLRSKIAFGPFLVIGFFITLAFFDRLSYFYQF